MAQLHECSALRYVYMNMRTERYSASEMGLYISLFQFFYLSSFGSEIHISALLLSIYFLSEIHSSSIVSHNLPQIKI